MGRVAVAPEEGRQSGTGRYYGLYIGRAVDGGRRMLGGTVRVHHKFNLAHLTACKAHLLVSAPVALPLPVPVSYLCVFLKHYSQGLY